MLGPGCFFTPGPGGVAEKCELLGAEEVGTRYPTSPPGVMMLGLLAWGLVSMFPWVTAFWRSVESVGR